MKKAALLWLMACSLALGACGGGSPTAVEREDNTSPEATDTGEEAPPELPADVVAQADLVLLAGTEAPGALGFGLQGEAVTSPGPTIRFAAGEPVTVVLHNIDVSLHDFVAVTKKSVDARPVWGAVITKDGFVEPNDYGMVTFTPDKKGRFFYICTRAGHLDQQMWGRLIVE